MSVCVSCVRSGHLFTSQCSYLLNESNRTYLSHGVAVGTMEAHIKYLPQDCGAVINLALRGSSMWVRILWSRWAIWCFFPGILFLAKLIKRWFKPRRFTTMWHYICIHKFLKQSINWGSSRLTIIWVILQNAQFLGKIRKFK